MTDGQTDRGLQHNALAQHRILRTNRNVNGLVQSLLKSNASWGFTLYIFPKGTEDDNPQKSTLFQFGTHFIVDFIHQVNWQQTRKNKRNK